MNNKMRFIITTCWLGIVADFTWAIGLFHPSLFVFLTGKSEMIVDLQLRLIGVVTNYVYIFHILRS